MIVFVRKHSWSILLLPTIISVSRSPFRATTDLIVASPPLRGSEASSRQSSEHALQKDLRQNPHADRSAVLFYSPLCVWVVQSTSCKVRNMKKVEKRGKWGAYSKKYDMGGQLATSWALREIQ